MESLGRQRNTKRSTSITEEEKTADARPLGRVKKEGRKHLTDKRWAFKKMDADMVGAVAQIAIWPKPPPGQVNNIERETEWFHRAMESICDASMPRVRRYTRGAVY